MDYKKIKTDQLAITRNVRNFDQETGNIYESTTVLAKRANQIASEIKQELDSKIEEFTSSQDNLEEIFENREQIEIAKYYEKLPKPTLIAVHEFLRGKIYFRNPHKEKKEGKPVE
jgi:DNA-directed RNA polymerase subunit K/omega